MGKIYESNNRWVLPRKEDLTAKKIEQRMSFIKPGDYVMFDSMKTCANAITTVKAIGEVVENCGGYLMVKLPRGVIESVNYFGIYAVNGLRFSGYTKK